MLADANPPRALIDFDVSNCGTLQPLMQATDCTADTGFAWQFINYARGTDFPAGTIRLVREKSKPSEPLFGFVELDTFNFLANRPQIGRFYISGFACPKKEWREEVFRDLERAKPPIVLMKIEPSILPCLQMPIRPGR